MIKKSLIKLADHLDKKGLHKEANYVDHLIKSYANERSDALFDLENDEYNSSFYEMTLKELLTISPKAKRPLMEFLEEIKREFPRGDYIMDFDPKYKAIKHETDPDPEVLRKTLDFFK